MYSKTTLFLCLNLAVFLFCNNILWAQCPGNNCSVCEVQATISNVEGAVINTGVSSLSDELNPGDVGVGTPMELTTTGCGAVSLTITVSYLWEQGANISWIHGISYSNSPGWTVAQGSNPGGGWLWQNSITGCCSGATYGAGYYFDGTTSSSFCCGEATSGNPADNYGVSCSGSGCPSFSFDLSYCPTSDGQSTETVTFTITDDGETGDWSQPSGCVFSAAFPIIINNDDFTIVASDTLGPIAAGDSLLLDAGSGCDNYVWSDGQTGAEIYVTPDSSTAYCVTASNSIGCETVGCVNVLVDGDTTIDPPPPPAITMSSEYVEVGEPVGVFVNNISQEEGYETILLVADATGFITAVEDIDTSGHSFTFSTEGIYFFYSFTYLESAFPNPPNVGNNINNINCTSGNCIVHEASVRCVSQGLLILEEVNDIEALVQQHLGGEQFSSISNITYNEGAIGLFYNGASNIGLSEGIVLCTAPLSEMIGTNIGTGQGGATIGCTGSGQDEDLALLSGSGICDAAVLEFDFIPAGDSISIQYVFASDEYCDFAPSQFNDVFGFFLSGPGIDGGNIYTDNAINAALIPGTDIPVSIKTVHYWAQEPGPDYYVSNISPNEGIGFCSPNELQEGGCCNDEVAFDGFTTVLEAKAATMQGATYHLKMVIGDAADQLWGSALFITSERGCFSPLVEVTLECCDANNDGMYALGENVEIHIDGTFFPENTCIDWYYTFDDTIDISTLADTHILGCTPLPWPYSDNFTLTIPDSLNVFQDTIMYIQGIPNPLPIGCDGSEETIKTEPIAVLVQGEEILPPLAYFLNPPPDTTLQCGESLPPLEPLQYTSGDPNNPNEGTIIGLQNGAVDPCLGGTVQYVWSGTDNFGNPLEHTQTITIEPAPTAVLVNPPADITLACDDAIPPLEPLIFDNGVLGDCANTGQITGVQFESFDGCSGFIHREWIGVDKCSNPLVYTQIITITACPEITNTLFSVENNNTFCGSEEITFTVDASNLPTDAHIDWYIDTVPDFNPYLGEGTQIGTSEVVHPDITNACMPCPQLSAIMIDACNTQNGAASEVANEFLIIHSGGGIPAASGIQINLDDQNNYQPPQTPTGVNNDINFGNNPCSFLDAPTPFLMDAIRSSTHCDATNVIGIGPNDAIPPNALVFVFMSPMVHVAYNFDGLCAEGRTIYVLQNACTRTVAAFTNNTSPLPNSCRLYEVYIDCNGDGVAVSDGCYSVIAYNTNNASNDGGFLGGYIYAYDANDNGVIDYGDACNPSFPAETIHVNNIPCDAPHLENIPFPDIETDTHISFTHQTDYVECGQPGVTYHIIGIINPLDDSCVSTNDDYSNAMTETFTYTLLNCDAPTLTITPENPVLDCTTTEVVLEAITDAPNPAFEWINANGIAISTAPTISATQAGVYTLIVTNTENSCTSSETVEVLSDVDVPIVDISSSGTLSCTTTEVVLEAITDAPNPAFEWINANGIAISTAPTISVTQAGVYTLIVTNLGNDCYGEASVEVASSADLIAEWAAIEHISCFGEADGYLEVSVLSGQPPYVFEWNNGQVGNPIDNLSAGVYDVTVSDASGCSTVLTTTITEPEELVLEVDYEDENLDCSGSGQVDYQLIMTGGTPPYSYLWSDGSTLPQNPMLLVGGITVTDANGCIAVADIDAMVDNTAPEVLISGSTTFCEGESTILTVGTDIAPNIAAIEWTNSEGTVIGTGQMLEVFESGTYCVRATNTENGCVGEDCVDVIEGLSPTVTLGVLLNCYTPVDTLLFDEYSPGTIEVFDEAGNLIGANPDIIIDQCGTFYVTGYYITDTSGCTTQDTVVLEVACDFAPPTFTISKSSDIDCDNSTVTLTAEVISGGDVVFDWYDAEGNRISLANSTQVSECGVYTAVATDFDNGCTGSQTIEVLCDEDVPEVELEDVSICEGSDPPLNTPFTLPSPLVIDQWTLPDGTVVQNEDLELNQAGTYCALIRNTENSCTAESCFELTIVPDPEVEIVASNETIDCNNTTVTLTVEPHQFVSYQWSTGDGTASTTINTCGTYSITVVTAEGCTAVATKEILCDTELPEEPVIEVLGALSCTVIETIIRVVNPRPDYTYQWINENGVVIGNTSSIMAVACGEYTLITTAPNGCMVENLATVACEDNVPLVVIAEPTMLNCQNESVLLDASGSSTGPEYTNVWTGPNGFTTDQQNPTVQTPGTYTLTVTNTQNGCSSASSVEVIESNPTAVIVGDSEIDCIETEAVLDATNSEGEAPLTYQWFAPTGSLIGTSATITVLEGGYYSLIVFDANGCSDQALFLVEELEVTINFTYGEALCHDDTVAVQVTVTGIDSDANISYNWTSGTFENGEVLLTKDEIFALTVTDATSGCSWEATTEEIDFPDALYVRSLYVTDDINETANAYIAMQSGGGTPPYYYEWSTGAMSSTIYNLSAGYYDVTVTDAHDCTVVVDSVEVQSETILLPPEPIDSIYELVVPYKTKPVEDYTNKEVTSEARFTIAPNPTNGSFFIHSTQVVEDADILIYNQIGQVILEENGVNLRENHPIRLSESAAQGLYFVYIQYADGTRHWLEKIVLSR